MRMSAVLTYPFGSFAMRAAAVRRPPRRTRRRRASPRRSECLRRSYLPPSPSELPLSNRSRPDVPMFRCLCPSLQFTPVGGSIRRSLAAPIPQAHVHARARMHARSHARADECNASPLASARFTCTSPCTSTWTCSLRDLSESVLSESDLCRMDALLPL